jgi:hypothetical protein
MSQRQESIHNTAHIQAQNRFFLSGPAPRFLQIKLKVDPSLRCWTCRAGAAGAGKYLTFFAGTFPPEIARTDEVRAQSYCLAQATRKIKLRYPGAQIVSIDFNPESAGAPLARLAMNGGQAWAA